MKTLIIYLVLVAAAAASQTLNVLMVGQSNMHGSLGSNVTVPMEQGLRDGTATRLARTWLTWYGKIGDPNSIRLHHVRPYSYSVGIWGPEVFGGWALANADHDVVLTKATKGGQRLDYFVQGGAGWDLMVAHYGITSAEAVTEGLNPLGPIDVLWWGQGESGSTLPGGYYANLVTYIEDVRAQFSSPSMKVVFMGLGPRFAGSEPELAFQTYVTNHPGAAIYVNGSNLDVRGNHLVKHGETDTTHYSAIGQRTLGVQMAAATLALVNPTDDRDGDGLDAVGEFLAGTDISLADTDVDGLSDGQEVSAGTDPLHDDSAMVASILDATARQTVGLSEDGTGRLRLQLYESETLSGWVPLGDPVDWSFPVIDRNFFRIEIK
ncbi:sialate O-acetylesterase [Haloferula sp.]|uniref:sialate O-acetylesterase n=1 Tax=Haloferula sp. TaxID=2497595 RepID=UPI0032A02D71